MLQVLFIKLRRNLPSEPYPITQSENKRVDYIYDDQEELLSLQQSFQKTLEEKQGDIIEREDAIRKIESDMLDINDIMRDLGTMIESQGDKLGKTCSGDLHLSMNRIGRWRLHIELSLPTDCR